VHVVSADVRDGHRLSTILDFVETDYGAIDVAICNAGRGFAKLLVNQTLEEAQEVMQVRFLHACSHTASVHFPRCGVVFWHSSSRAVWEVSQGGDTGDDVCRSTTSAATTQRTHLCRECLNGALDTFHLSLP